MARRLTPNMRWLARLLLLLQPLLPRTKPLWLTKGKDHFLDVLKTIQARGENIYLSFPWYRRACQIFPIWQALLFLEEFLDKRALVHRIFLFSKLFASHP